MKRKNRSQSRYLAYLWIFAVGITVLYSFSLLPRPTGFAVGDTPAQCQDYASANDPYCDDDKTVCADKYVEGKSLPACKECTTGQWKQPKWCKGQDAATSTQTAGGTTPSECEEYAKANDPYCDDAQEVCADKYVAGTSLVACHECTTGQYKQLKWCKGTAQAISTPTPSIVIAKDEYIATFNIEVLSRWNQTGGFRKDDVIVPTYRFSVTKINETTASVCVLPSYGDLCVKDPSLISPIDKTFKIGESVIFDQEVDNRIKLTLLEITK